MDKSESLYVGNAAKMRDIPIIGAEPDEEYIINNLMSQGYEAGDYVFYTVVRQIGEWKLVNGEDDSEFENMYDKFVGTEAKACGMEPEMFLELKKFKTWYRKRNGKTFAYSDITTDTIAPDCSETAPFTNRMSCLLAEYRDTPIVNVVAEMLNKYDDVLIIYGAGHHIIEYEVLRDMLLRPSTTTGGRTGGTSRRHWTAAPSPPLRLGQN